MEIRRLNPVEASAAKGFFPQLEGRLGTFTVHDPGQPVPLGRATENLIAAGDTPAASRT